MTQTQLFVAAVLTGVFAALLGIILALAQARVVLRRVTEIHKDMNSRLDELIKAEKSISFAAGEEAGRKENK